MSEVFSWPDAVGQILDAIADLRDRVETLDGTLEIHSPPGEGTKLVAAFPIEPS